MNTNINSVSRLSMNLWCTESSRTSDILVQATTENLKIWEKVPIISDKHERQSVSTPQKQLGLYEIAEGLCFWCKGCRILKLEALPAHNRYVAGHPREVYMTSAHSPVVQVRATAQDCSWLRRVMQNYLLGLCGAMDFFA